MIINMFAVQMKSESICTLTKEITKRVPLFPTGRTILVHPEIVPEDVSM